MSWTVASDIAERIKDLRRVLGTGSRGMLSQEELGRRAGVRPSQVSQWERGVQQPSKSRLESWAEREGWPVTVFAEGEPKPSETMSVAGGSTDARGSSATDGWEGGADDPDAILARFYRLMASAAERGTPWPAELAGVMEEMHRVAKRGSGVARETSDRGVGGQPGNAVPGW